jgi:Tol biopolymer transport system component
MTAEPVTRRATEMVLFPSLASIRAAHRELLKQHREGGNAPEILGALHDFIWRVRVSGALLDQDADRQAAQSLLDYWSTRLYRLGHEVPDAILAEFDPSLAPDLADSLNPYMGLEAFQENNQGVFFGRQRLIESLIEHLKNNRLLALVGPSGSGKSSVVRAGLASALKGGALPGSDQWLYLPPIVPGARPLVTLARLAQQISGDTSGRLQPQAAFLKTPNQLLQSATGDVVVIVDQFEEVFTLCGDDRVRTAFVNNLLGLVQAPGAQHVVILTMRTDFEGQVARLPDFEPLFEKALERVTPLNAGEIREAIEGPANLVGLKFEEGMVEALINDVLGEPAALPLLQFTLLKLWEARDRNRVTWAAYRRLGGGRQALANSADAFYRQLIPEDQMTARRILLRLVRPGEGLEVTSNRMQRGRLYYKAEARDRIDRVLDKLIQARLLHRTPGETNADDQIAVAHEALVRNWPTLIAWLEEERQHIRERNRLTTAAEQWQLRGRDASALWRGALLEEAAHDTDLNELETEFIKAGQAVLAAAAAAERAAHERELEAARKLAGAEKQRAETEKQRAEEQAQSASRLRRFNRLLTGLGAVALLAAVFACVFGLAAAFFGLQSSKNAASAQAASTQAVAQKGIAVDERDRADAQAQLALARQLSAQSVALSNYQLDLALLLGLEANRITDTVETRSSLLSALSLSSQLQARLGDHQGTVAGVAFSPKDNLLASASYDRSIILWDANGDHFVSRNPTDCGCPVTSVAFSPDGKILAAGSDKQVFLLSNLNSSTPSKVTLTDYPNWVRTVAFSPDGTLVAGAGDDHSIYVWDLASHQVVGSPLTGDTDLIWSIAFSPDGSLLASGSQDGSIRLWDVASGKQLGSPVATQATPVLAVAFSPDGATLASGGGDNMIWLWDVKTRKAIGDPLANHSAPVRSVAFSPDGTTLASGSEDTTVALWDVATHALLGQPLIGHTGRVATWPLARMENGWPRAARTTR